MTTTPRLIIAATLTGVVIITAGQHATTQEPQGAVSIAAGFQTTIEELRQFDAQVDAMARTGELVVTSRRADRALAGRTHEYLAQYVAGMPVHGGGVSRQLDNGVTVSLFGTIHEGIDVDAIPVLSGAEAVARLEARVRATLAGRGPEPALVILPLLDGTYALTYRAIMSDRRMYFVDAHSGETVREIDVTREQGAIGVGTGIVGDRKKVSSTAAAGVFQAIDQLRPGEIVTLDMRRNEQRTTALLDGAAWLPSDVATDSDNTWDDNPGAVDGHVHTGWTYDYFAQQHGYDGIDGANGRILSLVNIEFSNAFFVPPPFGPAGRGAFAYGEDEGGTSFAVADIVAHELMHGVTHASVSSEAFPFGLSAIRGIPGPRSFRLRGTSFNCNNLAIRYEDGALMYPFCTPDGRFMLWSFDGGVIDEAFADIFATAVEFFHDDDGTGPLTADYLLGEDMPSGPYRSLENPRSISISETISYPDAASQTVRYILATRDGTSFRGGFRWASLAFIDGRFVGVLSHDSGGVHINSTILSHAFYLAIEGGRNATTGLTAEGIGAANRKRIEQVFFRAMTDLMPPMANIGQAAGIIRHSGVDLFGLGSPEHVAVDQALRAVGL